MREAAPLGWTASRRHDLTSELPPPGRAVPPRPRCRRSDGAAGGLCGRRGALTELIVAVLSLSEANLTFASDSLVTPVGCEQRPGLFTSHANGLAGFHGEVRRAPALTSRWPLSAEHRVAGLTDHSKDGAGVFMPYFASLSLSLSLSGKCRFCL